MDNPKEELARAFAFRPRIIAELDRARDRARRAEERGHGIILARHEERQAKERLTGNDELIDRARAAIAAA